MTLPLALLLRPLIMRRRWDCVAPCLGKLRTLVPDIVDTLKQMAPEIAPRAHAADAKAKEAARLRDQEELDKARVATEKRRNEPAAASRKDFLQLIEQWALAERVGAFCVQLTQ